MNSHEIGHTPSHLGFARRAAVSLMRPNHAVDTHRAMYQRISQEQDYPQEPLNTEEEVISSFMSTIHERHIRAHESGIQRPYWDTSKRYNPLDMFGVIIQVLDYHDSPLPEAALPPSNDVREYINRIMNRDGKVTVGQQFEELLDITGNNLLGALHLGFIASRFMARGLDTRAYPDIPVSDEDMLAWSRKIAQFKVSEDHHSDSPGDTYYFWTHMFASLYYQLNKNNRRLYQTTFEHGTEIMKFVRSKIARTPITADHHEASIIGRNFGLALANPDCYESEEVPFVTGRRYSDIEIQQPTTSVHAE